MPLNNQFTAAQLPSALGALGVGTKPRIRIASPSGGMYAQSTQASNGTSQTSGTDRIPFIVNTDVVNPQVVLTNSASQSGSGTPVGPGNAVTFHMELEFGGTTPPTPVSFPSSSGAPVSTGGQTGNFIGNGEIQISSPTVSRGALAAGSTQFLRLYKTVAAGGKWPLTYGSGNYNFIASSTTDKLNGTTDQTGSDQTHVASPTWGAMAGGTLLWSPLAIIGKQVTPKAVVMATGDSISAGFGDQAGRGYITRACESASVSYHNDGVISITTFNLAYNMDGARYLADYVDYVCIHIGTNDLNTGAITTLVGMQAAYLAVAQSFAREGNKLLFSTILPRPTGDPTTYTGQTKPAWEAVRVQINNWLRDTSVNGAKAQLNAALNVRPTKDSVFATYDPCVQLERNNDGSNVVLDGNGQQSPGVGGYFLINASADLTHPNPAGAALASLVVPTAQMVLFS